jgi:hypothetical protein
MRRKYREPDWPRLMNVDAACAYLGFAERETFLTTIAPALLSVKLPDGTIRYDRRHLDAWVDAIGIGQPQRRDEDWLKEVSDAQD